MKKKFIIVVVAILLIGFGYKYYSDNYTYEGFIKNNGFAYMYKFPEGNDFFNKGYRNNYILLSEDHIVISEAKKVPENLRDHYPSSVVKFDLEYPNPKFDKKTNTLSADIQPAKGESEIKKVVIEVLDNGSLKYNDLVYEPCDIKDIEVGA